MLIEDRDEIESFQGYLKVFDPVGLQFLQLWLTLRGYEKEYHRRLAELDQPNRHITDFIKWNIKCAKALIDKYFRQTRNDSRPAQVQNFQYEVELHIQQTKAMPSIDTIAQLQNSLKNLLSVLQTLLEVIQFKAFCEHNQSTTKEIAAIKQISKKATAKYLPRLPENEVCIICFYTSWYYKGVSLICESSQKYQPGLPDQNRVKTTTSFFRNFPVNLRPEIIF